MEFAIHTLVETRLETSGFEQKYRNDETERTAYDPKILLKIKSEVRQAWGQYIRCNFSNFEGQFGDRGVIPQLSHMLPF